MRPLFALLALLVPLLAQAQPAAALKASELIGMEVTNRASGVTGRIDDLVIDIANGRVHFVMLDMTGPLITQPMAALKLTDGAATIEAARDWNFAAQEGIALMRASSLIGYGFESEAGEPLGKIADLAVDPAGNIPFAIVRLKNDRERLRVAPLDAFRMSVWRENLLLVPEANALVAAPPFSAAQLDAGLGERQFVQHQAALAGKLTPESATAAAGGQSRSQLFACLDRDGNGVLTDTELGQTPAARRSWIALDLDRDGRITAAEFTAMQGD